MDQIYFDSIILDLVIIIYLKGDRDIMKPCPFCENENVELTNNLVGQFYVQCMGCGCCGPCETDQEEAIEKWQTRKGTES